MAKARERERRKALQYQPAARGQGAAENRWSRQHCPRRASSLGGLPGDWQVSSPIFWTPDKDRLIYEHYPDGGASAVMPHLDGVSHGRIKNRAGVLGVKMTEEARRAALGTSVRRGPPSDTLSKLLAARW